MERPPDGPVLSVVGETIGTLRRAVPEPEIAGRRTGGAPAGASRPGGEAETATTRAWMLRSE